MATSSHRPSRLARVATWLRILKARADLRLLTARLMWREPEDTANRAFLPIGYVVGSLVLSVLPVLVPISIQTKLAILAVTQATLVYGGYRIIPVVAQYHSVTKRFRDVFVPSDGWLAHRAISAADGAIWRAEGLPRRGVAQAAEQLTFAARNPQQRLVALQAAAHAARNANDDADTHTLMRRLGDRWLTLAANRIDQEASAEQIVEQVDALVSAARDMGTAPIHRYDADVADQAARDCPTTRHLHATVTGLLQRCDELSQARVDALSHADGPDCEQQLRTALEDVRSVALALAGDPGKTELHRFLTRQLNDADTRVELDDLIAEQLEKLASGASKEQAAAQLPAPPADLMSDGPTAQDRANLRAVR